MILNTSTARRNILLIFLGIIVCFIGYFLILLNSVTSLKESNSGSPQKQAFVKQQRPAKSIETKTGTSQAGQKAVIKVTSSIIPSSKQEIPTRKAIIIPKALKEKETTFWIDRQDNNVCFVMLGSDAGVVEGMIFDIYDSNVIVGKMKAQTVYEGYSVGEVISGLTALRGDYFTARVGQG